MACKLDRCASTFEHNARPFPPSQKGGHSRAREGGQEKTAFSTPPPHPRWKGGKTWWGPGWTRRGPVCAGGWASTPREGMQNSREGTTTHIRMDGRVHTMPRRGARRERTQRRRPMKNRNSFDGCMDAYHDNPHRSGGNVACVQIIVPAVCSSSQEGVQGRSSCPSKTKLLPMEGTGTTLRHVTTTSSWKEACAAVASITCRCIASYRSVRDERHMAAQKSRHRHPAQRKNKATAVRLPRHLFPSPIGLKKPRL